MKQTLLSALILLCALKTICQPGKLDNSFSSDGKVTTLVGNTEANGESVAIQSNGKIVVGGFYFNTSHNNNDFAVVRYNTNGSLDNSFAGNGKAGIDFGADDFGVSTAIQSNGDIVVVGYSDSYSPQANYFIAARLTTAGTLDPSFGSGGKVKFSFRGEMKSVAIQTDGKIVVAGDSGIANSKDFALFRLNSNGTLDNSFGIGGEVFTAFSGLDDEGNSVAIQSDGKILAGGFTLRNGIRCFAIARYNTNGSLDASFGGDGKVSTSVGNTGASAFALAVKSNGKIFQSGEYTDSKGYGQFAAVKYNADGTLDNSFAGNGKVAVSFNSGGGNATSINIQSNGKIILAGINSVSENYNFALARLNTNGTLDNSFGSSGKVITDFGGNDYGISSAIQSDGKIVVAGISITDKYRIAVARYLGSGSSSNAIAENNIDDAKAWSSSIQIYPNPVADAIHVEGLNSLSANFIISNINGSILERGNFTAVNPSIKADMLKPGIYNLTVDQNGKIINLKFIKQ